MRPFHSHYKFVLLIFFLVFCFFFKTLIPITNPYVMSVWWLVNNVFIIINIILFKTNELKRKWGKKNNEMFEISVTHIKINWLHWTNKWCDEKRSYPFVFVFVFFFLFCYTLIRFHFEAHFNVFEQWKWMQSKHYPHNLIFVCRLLFCFSYSAFFYIFLFHVAWHEWYKTLKT